MNKKQVEDTLDRNILFDLSGLSIQKAIQRLQEELEYYSDPENCEGLVYTRIELYANSFLPTLASEVCLSLVGFRDEADGERAKRLGIEASTKEKREEHERALWRSLNEKFGREDAK